MPESFLDTSLKKAHRQYPVFMFVFELVSYFPCYTLTTFAERFAKRLLGMGDMLLVPPGCGSPVRLHGNFVSEEEIHKIVRHLKKQGAPQYKEDILKNANLMNMEFNDGRAEKAMELQVIEDKKRGDSWDCRGAKGKWVRRHETWRNT